MEVSSSAKVGMVTVLALILFALVFTQIGGGGNEHGTEYVVTFQNVGGLQTKAPVLLAGVKVGVIKKLELDNVDSRVKVTMLITRDKVSLYRNRRAEDQADSFYIYTIAGNLLGDKWLDIRTGRIPPGTPVLRPEDPPIQGDPPVSLDDLAREGNEVMAEFRHSVKALNELVADTKFQSDIKETLGNFNEIAKNLKGASVGAKTLVTSLKGRVERLGNSVEMVVAHVDQTVSSFQSDARAVGSDLRGFTSQLRGVIGDNQGHLNGIVRTLHETAVSLNRTVKSLDELAQNKELKADVLAAVSNLRKTSEEVQGIASDIRSVTADPEVQGDLRDTVQNAKEASESAKEVMGKVKGVVKGATGGKLFSAYIDNEWNTHNGHPATNLNAFILPGAPYGAKIGIDSLGQDNLVNLQATKNWDNFRVRGGVIRSQFGLGADAMFFDKKLEMSVDAYNTSKVKLDVTGKLLLPYDFYLLGGYRDITDSSRGYPIIGAGKKF